ncbi:uncharacterized protein [Elaeis guineensis]|uniref:Uncharacterized protein LOC105039128 n=1 Tax=Elaeis guineensis var. tenera TaxID=51953 RepID=A0A6I9QUB3_ELAGV|nr:uncharacterized protein LOC105039128 [Elaeis guineensis]
MVCTNKRTAAAKSKIKEEDNEENGGDYISIKPPKIEEEGPSSGSEALAEKATKLTPGPSKGPVRLPPKATLAVNRRRLSGLLKKLARTHNWKEASDVLSVLLRGTPRGSSFAEDRRNFLVAMEIHKRLGETNGYQTKIKKMFEIWMSKLVWMQKNPKKRHSVQLELALFYLSQGNIQEAHNATKFLIQDQDSASEPTINLLHGMISYQLWYSGLPEEMQINDFGIQMPSGTYDMAIDDGFEESEMLESSNDHNAIDIVNANYSSRCASESSVGNEKIVFMECKNEMPKGQSSDVRPAHEFYLIGSEANEGRPTPPNLRSHFEHSSIFFAHGLDTSLLPIRLMHMDGDLEQSIYSYRRLANDQYEDAVKHLRLALYSTPPLLPSLLPLVQLLLLGDRVGEALDELEKSCNIFDAALPFRLRARLLESFHSSPATIISSCYEEALKRDPTCNLSLERLIKMHKNGNYSTILLLEMMTLHLDAADGKSSIWGELASCFLKLLTATISDYEDRISANVRRDPTSIVSSGKIPTAFTKGQARKTWRVRCRWWLTRHFSKNAYLSEMQAGDWELLTSKAACASHLYGPENDYAKAVLSSLQEGGDNDRITFLDAHLRNPMKLHGFLNKAASQRDGFHEVGLETG